MKTLAAAEFQAVCLKPIEAVTGTGETPVITRNGQPVARLGPALSRPKTLVGLHEGQIKILGDIISPIDVEWEAQR